MGPVLFLFVRIVVMTSRIDPALIQAYRETQYRVLGAHSMVLRPDVFSNDLAALHQTLAVDCSGFITACNPYSQVVDARANTQRQSELAGVLASCGLVVFEGMGKHPNAQWTAEPSFLVAGIALDEACAMGRQFEQNAIIWSGADATPHLILLR